MYIENIINHVENPLLKGFIETEKGKQFLQNFLNDETEENLEKLEKAFKFHYVKIKTFAYFSKVVGFEAKRFDQNRRKDSDRFSLVLDAPVAGEKNIILKDTVIDKKQGAFQLQSERFEYTIKDEQVLKALNGLTSRQKQTLCYYFYHSMKDREIAIKLGVSSQAVSKNKRAALKKMRKEMSGG